MEGCYHCKVVSPCLPYLEYNDRNKSMCIDHCVVDTDCAGIIFNRQTQVCQLYLGVRGCLKYMEYTDEQSYILTKDVSRNGRYEGITFSSTPSNPFRLAHMMRLAQMARVQGFLVECKY